MIANLDTYSGYLVYQDEEFAFSFSGDELHLIPPKEKKDELKWRWFHEELIAGVSTGKTRRVRENYIVGECYESGTKIIFIPIPHSYVSTQNSILIIRINAYIIYEYDRPQIDRIGFSCPEINHIYPAANALQYEHDAEARTFGIKTISIDDTRSREHKFLAFDKEIVAYWGMNVQTTRKIGTAPLQVSSTLYFCFDPTEDFEFIIKLYWLAIRYIQFLTYRKNVKIPVAVLSAPYKDGLHEKCAELRIINQDADAEEYPIDKDMVIHQSDVDGAEGDILSDIATETVYMRHLPDSYRSGRSINEARFVMIVAAIEWEFQRIHPEGLEKSQKTIEAEDHCREIIDGLISNSTGKEKNIYKRLKNLIDSEALPQKINQIGKEFSFMTEQFGNRLYHMNESSLNYAEMAKRLSDQRNHFAHGDLDKEFIGDSLLDLIYLEWIIYAMQLSYYHLPQDRIISAIKSLFNQH